jgi:H+/Cl- antiporter ClcA
MKTINLLFIMVFVLSAALQYNDPDPYLWMLIYLYGAFLCYQAIRKKYNQVLYIVGFAIYISFALYLLVARDGVLSWVNEHDAENIAASMQATKPWIEDTREFFGLLILIFALLINMIWFKKMNKKTAK